MRCLHIHVVERSARVSVGVVGVAGTAGGELVRLLTNHPDLEIAAVAGAESVGRTVAHVHPHLGSIDTRIVGPEEVAGVDVAFLALPHGRSAEIAPALLEAGTRVIDLGGDFRLEAGAYPEWYGFEHPAAAWLDKAVYGLTEAFREQVRGAALVANPGCFPTPVVLGVAPLLWAGLLEPAPIVIDGKTGLSGAGKSLSAATSHLATEESVRPYRAPRHQHTPEIERAIELATGVAMRVTFVPHLVPAVRGVLTTTFARAAAGTTTDALVDALREAYASEPFVRVLPPDGMVDTKRVRGSNVVELQAAVDRRTGSAFVVGAIDNLVKGAAGQGIQNLNVMFGLDERTALPTVGVYP